MKKNLPLLSVVILFLVLCCKKSGTGDVEQNQQTDKENLPGYVKLLEGNFAVKSDGSLWGGVDWQVMLMAIPVPANF
ncbi:hypothetical protein [Sphingobacterium spiritivorum]|uniref:hypothetical protein n=1 Tax=Sphingobacterium spiritivorum TaxID=258 RepID=UPI003DA5EC4A